MRDWRPFDTNAFLKSSRHWDDRIKRLQTEMENISVLPSYDNKAGVSSGNISDMTAQTALRRLQIQSEIEELLLYKEMLNFALKRLTEDERALIDGFYYPTQSIESFLDEYGKASGLCRTHIYEKRSRVLEKMGEMILAEYYE